MRQPLEDVDAIGLGDHFGRFVPRQRTAPARHPTSASSPPTTRPGSMDHADRTILPRTSASRHLFCISQMPAQTTTDQPPTSAWNALAAPSEYPDAVPAPIDHFAEAPGARTRTQSTWPRRRPRPIRRPGAPSR